MRVVVWIAGFWLGSLLALAAQGPPSPPGLAVAYPFEGNTVNLSSSAFGETLAAQDFGSVPLDQSKDIYLAITFSAPQQIFGVQYEVQPGAKADFAIFSSTLPTSIAILPIVIEFRPKSIGTHRADLWVIGAGNRRLVHIPITGTGT